MRLGSGFAENIGKIHGKPDLGAERRARNILAAKDAEVKSQTRADLVLTSSQDLELGLPQLASVCIPTVHLAAQCEPVREVVQEGESSRIDVASRALNAQRACTAVPGKQVAKVPSQPRLA